MKLYIFGLLPGRLSCFGGGGGTPSAPLPSPPPPQLAKIPEAATVRQTVSEQNIAQGSVEKKSTLATGGMGDAIALDKLSKKTLLGSAA